MFNCKEMAEKLLKIQEIKNKHPESLAKFLLNKTHFV